MNTWFGWRGPGWLTIFLVTSAASACGPAQTRLEAPQAAEPPAPPDVVFKRVDEWQFVELDAPLTSVEQQLKRQFEREFTNARHSQAYQCYARENASFYEKYGALPDQNLGMDMMGRCRTPAPALYGIRIYYSDGTLLDSPLSEVNLADMSLRLVDGLPPFTTFGVTARAVGPNVLVMLETGSPPATISVGEPNAARDVVVEGEILGDFDRAFATINQGLAGTASCAPVEDEPWPRYGFRCPMAANDAEAWIQLSAAAGEEGWETPLVSLPAHETGWVPSASYRRATPELPEHVETRRALLTSINELRTQQGKRALEFATEQSQFIEPIYERMFPTPFDANLPLRAQLIRGDRVRGPVAYGRIATGMAFDGDAADWLVWNLKSPLNRATLMSDAVDQLALATHGDPRLGFGGVAVVYALLTDERDSALRDALAESISKLRGKLATNLLDAPPELEALDDEIARGAPPRKALETAVQRANLSNRGSGYLTGVFVPLSRRGLDSLPPQLGAPRKLNYGIVVVHIPDAASGWYTPVGVVWFYTDSPPERLAGLANPNAAR